MTLGATSIFTEEVGPIVGGFAVHEGKLRLVPVMVAIAVGTWIATALLYGLGRWQSEWVERRERAQPGVLARALGAVRRRPWHTALVMRFAIGARIILPAACGAARVPVAVYLVGTAISSAAWSVTFVLIGWVFGQAAVAALGRFRDYTAVILGSLALLIAAGYLVMRQRAKRRAARVIAGTPDP